MIQVASVCRARARINMLMLSHVYTRSTDTQHGQEHNKCRGDYWGIIGCSVDGAWAPWGAGNPMDLEGLCDKETPIDVSKRKSSCWGAQCHDGIMPPQGAPATCNIPG